MYLKAIAQRKVGGFNVLELERQLVLLWGFTGLLSSG